jgi:hypothetical protein
MGARRRDDDYLDGDQRRLQEVIPNTGWRVGLGRTEGWLSPNKRMVPRIRTGTRMLSCRQHWTLRDVILGSEMTRFVLEESLSLQQPCSRWMEGAGLDAKRLKTRRCRRGSELSEEGINETSLSSI